MDKTFFKSFKKSLILSTALLQIAALPVSAFESQPARLSQSDKISVRVNGRLEEITLKAENQNSPLLNTNLKRTVELADTSFDVMTFMKDTGFSLNDLKTIFSKFGFNSINGFNDLIIVKNYAHGVKEISKTEIFKKSMSEEMNSNFWYAVFPRSAKVTRVLVQRDWFSSGAGAHAQLRFNLNSPLLLLPQNMKSNPQNIVDMTRSDWKTHFAIDSKSAHIAPSDFVYSLYALRYKDGPNDWSITTGMGGVFANAYTLSSTAHNVVYLAKDDFVEQFELTNPQNTGTVVLHSSLKRANLFLEKKIYHLLFNSCITEMNRALYADGKGYDIRKLGVNESDFNPYTFVEKLKPVLNKIPVPSLNAEFNSPVQVRATNAQIEKNIELVRSKEFEELMLNIALDSIDLSYRDLVAVKAAVMVIKGEADSGRGPKLSEIDTVEKARAALQKLGLQFSATQLSVLVKIATNQNIIKAVSMLTQRGLQ